MPAHARRRIGTGAILVAVAVALLIGVIVWAALSTRDPGGTAAPDGDNTSQSPPDASDPPQATADGMEGFIEDYLATASADPGSGFGMLTAGFQRDSGGLPGYRGFWDRVETADLISVEADPDALTVDYRVAYTMSDGGTSADDVSLDLVFDDGVYKVAGER